MIALFFELKYSYFRFQRMIFQNFILPLLRKQREKKTSPSVMDGQVSRRVDRLVTAFKIPETLVMCR